MSAFGKALASTQGPRVRAPHACARAAADYSSCSRYTIYGEQAGHRQGRSGGGLCHRRLSGAAHAGRRLSAPCAVYRQGPGPTLPGTVPQPQAREAHVPADRNQPVRLTATGLSLAEAAAGPKNATNSHRGLSQLPTAPRLLPSRPHTCRGPVPHSRQATPCMAGQPHVRLVVPGYAAGRHAAACSSSGESTTALALPRAMPLDRWPRPSGGLTRSMLTPEHSHGICGGGHGRAVERAQGTSALHAGEGSPARFHVERWGRHYSP